MDKYLTIENIKNNDNLIQECQAFYSNIDSLKSFGNYCNLKSFIYLFGDDEGARLWRCFVIDAKRNIYDLLLTYLDNEQKFIMIANIIRNKDLITSTL